jgi:acyl-coenzyme A thioesterase PaaI-like protein
VVSVGGANGGGPTEGRPAGGDRTPTGVPRPAGSRVDLDYVHAVAMVTNLAQAAMGTELLALARHGATVGLAWREDLADRPGGGLAPGVLACLLDHACGLAALMAVDDHHRLGGTMGLRVDHLAGAEPGRGVVAVGECVRRNDHVAHVRGEVRHADGPDGPGPLLAVGTATHATRP